MLGTIFDTHEIRVRIASITIDDIFIVAVIVTHAFATLRGDNS